MEYLIKAKIENGQVNRSGKNESIISKKAIM